MPKIAGPSGIIQEYRCQSCRKTTRRPAIRTPITILGTRVGEPKQLKSCPNCGEGTPALVIPDAQD